MLTAGAYSRVRATRDPGEPPRPTPWLRPCRSRAAGAARAARSSRADDEPRPARSAGSAAEPRERSHAYRVAAWPVSRAGGRSCRVTGGSAGVSRGRATCRCRAAVSRCRCGMSRTFSTPAEPKQGSDDHHGLSSERHRLHEVAATLDSSVGQDIDLSTVQVAAARNYGDGASKPMSTALRTSSTRTMSDALPVVLLAQPPEVVPRQERLGTRSPQPPKKPAPARQGLQVRGRHVAPRSLMNS